MAGKLGIIHEIKYSYGPGIGKPGPVDDWEKTNRPVLKHPKPNLLNRKALKSNSMKRCHLAQVLILLSGLEANNQT